MNTHMFLLHCFLKGDMPRRTAKDEFEQHRARSTRNPEEEILKRFRNLADVVNIARRTSPYWIEGCEQKRLG